MIISEIVNIVYQHITKAIGFQLLVSFTWQTRVKGLSPALAFIGVGFLFRPQNSLFWNLPCCLHVGSPLVA
jgi:hypothetical protein